ncbi:hypothetical protein [Phenylobacterium soli]|uniref:Uncharacterized protein n=1 Tax=Phenylobacterium soli TaxID=2170551 RepID=A0A328A9Y3_9CAUL|nr:hypothetical protein [Phenylobacterium soli]RAK51207.1 hypothetical protein DJ017_19850 [Phenylobacterium soli]
MNQSQYLAQALNQSTQFATPTFDTPDPQTMKAFMDKAKAFHQANPDGSFIGHQFMQAGRNLMGAPQNAMTGFQKMMQGLPGMGAPQAQTPFQPNGPMITPPSVSF